MERVAGVVRAVLRLRLLGRIHSAHVRSPCKLSQWAVARHCSTNAHFRLKDSLDGDAQNGGLAVGGACDVSIRSRGPTQDRGKFAACVVAGILGGLNLCRRRGVVEVTDGVLQVEQTSLFGRRQWQWPCDEIAAVQTGPTGLTIGGGTGDTGVTTLGGTRVPELHLYVKDGKRIGLFAGRSEAELEWIAATSKELHPYLTQEKLLRFCNENRIAVTGFSPLGALSYVELAGFESSATIGYNPGLFGGRP